MLVKKFLLILCDTGRLFRPVNLVRTIAKHALISGQCNDPLVSVIRKIRMFLYERINPRNHVIIPNRNASVILNISVLHIAVLIHNQLLCKSIAIHIMVVAHVILRQNERNLPRRKQDLPAGNRAICIYRTHIVQAYHHIALFIHALHDPGKFTHCCHNLIVTGFFCITVECLGRILDHCVEKDMCDLFQRICRARRFHLLIPRHCILQFLAVRIQRRGLQRLDRPVIIVLGCHHIRRRQQLILCTAASFRALCLVCRDASARICLCFLLLFFRVLRLLFYTRDHRILNQHNCQKYNNQNQQ